MIVRRSRRNRFDGIPFEITTDGPGDLFTVARRAKSESARYIRHCNASQSRDDFR
jgi:hypothetical protein